MYELPFSASSEWGGIHPREAVAEPGGDHSEVWEVAVTGTLCRHYLGNMGTIMG